MLMCSLVDSLPFVGHYIAHSLCWRSSVPEQGAVSFLSLNFKLKGYVTVLQLETVYVLEGLGPPKEDSYGQKSFSDQVHVPCVLKSNSRCRPQHSPCNGSCLGNVCVRY